MYTFCYKVLSPRRQIPNRLSVFRYLIVDIRYFSVLWIPTSVSVSVFQNIGYRFGISVYRPKTTANTSKRDDNNKISYRRQIAPASAFMSQKLLARERSMVHCKKNFIS